MTRRTIAIGDIHGELDHLLRLLDRIPRLTSEDTLLFIGDYLDRGPKSAPVIQFLIEALPEKTQATIVTLRGNHEDAWLKALAENDSDFVLPVGNSHCAIPLNHCLRPLGCSRYRHYPRFPTSRPKSKTTLLSTRKADSIPPLWGRLAALSDRWVPFLTAVKDAIQIPVIAPGSITQ